MMEIYTFRYFPPLLLYCDPQLLCTHTLLISSNVDDVGATCTHLRLFTWGRLNIYTNCALHRYIHIPMLCEGKGSERNYFLLIPYYTHTLHYIIHASSLAMPPQALLRPSVCGKTSRVSEDCFLC